MAILLQVPVDTLVNDNMTSDLIWSQKVLLSYLLLITPCLLCIYRCFGTEGQSSPPMVSGFLTALSVIMWTESHVCNLSNATLPTTWTNPRTYLSTSSIRPPLVLISPNSVHRQPKRPTTSSTEMERSASSSSVYGSVS